MASTPVAGADLSSAAIIDLDVTTADQGYLVSYRLVDVLPDEILERIHSGIEATFHHRVDLTARRMLPLMPARTLCRSTVSTTATYESLTQQYHLTRTFEYVARGEGGYYHSGEEHYSTSAIEDMEAWMTDIHDMLVPYPFKPADDVRRKIRVNVTLGRHFVLFVFPGNYTATAEWTLDF